MAQVIPSQDRHSLARTGLEEKFDITFTARLAEREKQIQQNYRPIIGIHKWFARRPGTVFRNLLLAEFNGNEPIEESYFRAHQMQGVIADPFMGGGTTMYEANRLGFSVVGTDINPMAYWIVRQSLARLDLEAFKSAAQSVVQDVERTVNQYYTTGCVKCGGQAQVKYFIWVKTQACPLCDTENDLFPGYLLAEAERHPYFVVACSQCGYLNEYEQPPEKRKPASCADCGAAVVIEGPARRNQITCRACGSAYPYPPRKTTCPPRHRLWAMEYHCVTCKPSHQGRFFKKPGTDDLIRFERAEARLKRIHSELPVPKDAIPAGDETERLHRWGYRHYHEMFNARQRLGLLLRRVMKVREPEARYALLTVFSDFLRYQNMLCRYDTYALKGQDIFSVHGFPVGLIQCEANLLGIPEVGSGGFRHFVEKYRRAKEYCEQPFETRAHGQRKQVVPIEGERIGADFVRRFPRRPQRQAFLNAAPATKVMLPPNSLDGVFTDPPYFDNVQYAELMDFCYVWLRQALRKNYPIFNATTTRAAAELTGNESMGRGLAHFTEGLSQVFGHYAAALKPLAPFVFTYHHNDPLAYVPLVVAILDAGLYCTATLPVPAEMGASLHIKGSQSSVLDSVFVCRRIPAVPDSTPLGDWLERDVTALHGAGLKVTEGDVRCLAAGHLARKAINQLCQTWDTRRSLKDRMAEAENTLAELSSQAPIQKLLGRLDVKARAAES